MTELMFTAVMLLKLTTVVFTVLTLSTAIKSLDLLNTHKEMREAGKGIFNVAKKHDIELKRLHIKKHMCNLLRPFVTIICILLSVSTVFVFIDLLISFSGLSQDMYSIFLFMGLGGFLYMDWLKTLLHRDILTMQYNFNVVMMREKVRVTKSYFDDLVYKLEQFKLK